METIKIKKEEEKQRIDKFLSEKLNLGRSTIQKLLLNEDIKINDNPVKSSYKTKENDEISIKTLEIHEEQDILPQKMDLNIVYEDDYLMIIDKPSGLVVHPAIGHYTDTLVNGLLYYSKSLSDVNGDFRPGIVHRIDKNTSGLLIVAKTNEAHQKLAEMIKNKTVKREYKAIVHGTIKEKECIIKAPIGRDVKKRKLMTVTDKNSKDAQTNIKVIDRNLEYSLIKCQLLTGRTHQIRVHLKYINHPVVGDPEYSSNKGYDTDGQALHSYHLTFNHPINGELLDFKSPLPIKMQKLLNDIKLNDEE